MQRVRNQPGARIAAFEDLVDSFLDEAPQDRESTA